MVATGKGQRRVELHVERLCQDGCARVMEYIRALQAGEDLPQLAELEQAEVAAVLNELISIMAAYEGSCKS